MQDAGEFDFAIVGAGSAGCPLAARLSEGGRHRVLLLEAGPPDRNPWIHLPIGYGKTFLDPKVNWKYETDPEPELGGRRIYWPRGKVLGGSSAINGLVYVRGVASDFDYWRQQGCEGWSFADLLPYFRLSEGNARGADEWHGGSGPLGVEDPRWQGPLMEAYIAAAMQAGLPRNEDFNGASQEGVGYFQLTVRHGRRSSAASAFLAPARGRENLRIVTGAHVEGLLFEGSRARGLVWRQGDGSRIEARVRGEIVLCGGSINSPQLLMLSGIGPAAHLREMGIEVRRDLPGVGENLHDHYQIRSLYRMARPGSLNEKLASPLGKIAMALEYLLGRRGLLTIGAGVVGAFARTRPELADPDIELHVIPFTTDRMGTGLHGFPGFTVNMNQSRPESRGRIRLASPDPGRAPSILANYLASETDRRTVVDGLKFVRRIAAQPALRDWIEREFAPGPEVEGDGALLDYARANGGSIYHPVGTCRMGPDHDPMAVVDPRLRVRGIEGLRVADASIMPQVVSGNSNAACIMIGEKCADMMRAENG